MRKVCMNNEARRCPKGCGGLTLDYYHESSNGNDLYYCSSCFNTVEWDGKNVRDLNTEAYPQRQKCDFWPKDIPLADDEIVEKILKGFVFEEADPVYTNGILFRVNDDGTRSIATRENLQDALFNAEIEGYKKGYATKLVSCESEKKEAVERARQSMKTAIEDEMYSGMRHKECEGGTSEICDVCLARTIHNRALQAALTSIFGDKK